MRRDGRLPDELRPVRIIRGFTRHAPGSVLIHLGDTIVLCTATIVEGLPSWRQPAAGGWLTAEYDMLPGSTPQRRPRTRAGADGRTREIERLIGRCLRSAVRLEAIGPRTIHIDCDVLQADGGTRAAAITGGYVALHDACAAGAAMGLWGPDVLAGPVAAVSAGVVRGALLLDLDYAEDAAAQADCNLVMNGRGQWIEVQISAEQAPFSEEQFDGLRRLGRKGILELLALQRAALGISPTP